MKKALIILAVIIANFTLLIDNCKSQWIYQALPSYREVLDIKFFDANTGVMIFNTSSHGMLRTTNGGNNWTLINNDITFYHLEKIDSSCLYANGRWQGIDRIHRTYDRGLTWDSVSVAFSNAYFSTSFVNRDTGWISGANNLNYNCIWKTTNGGVTLIQLTDTIGLGNIFFYKNKVNGEYIGWHCDAYGDFFWKTTNSGANWFQATRPPAQYLGYFEFYNDNTGWFTASSTGGGIYKSTNGGINWTHQILPSGNNINSEFIRFKIINLDTIYGSGGYLDLGPRIVGFIWKTTNGGLNWGYQQPDTSYYNGQYGAIDFVNTNTGWAFGGHGIHTINGGGPITFTAINNNSEIVATEYVLKQNYPNPFNPTTNIPFELKEPSHITLKVFDARGREVKELVNGRWGTGKFIADFDASALATGIYFYQIIVSGESTHQTFTATRKMIFLK